jgi:hypothetical protein
MRGNADGTGNFFAPVEIGEEVLSEALTGHWLQQCSRRGDPKLRLAERTRACYRPTI